MMGGLTFTDVSIGGRDDGFARLPCIKRGAFAHERDVRIVYQAVPGAGGPKGVNDGRVAPDVAFPTYDGGKGSLPRCTLARGGIDPAGCSGRQPSPGLFRRADAWPISR